MTATPQDSMYKLPYITQNKYKHKMSLSTQSIFIKIHDKPG